MLTTWSLTVRFWLQFTKDFWDSVWDAARDAVVVLAAVLYSGKKGNLSLSALRVNAVDVLFPFVWAMSLIALIHLVRTGIQLAKIVAQENAARLQIKHSSGILDADGKPREWFEPAPIVTHPKARTVAVVTVLALFPIGASFLSWKMSAISSSNPPVLPVQKDIEKEHEESLKVESKADVAVRRHKELVKSNVQGETSVPNPTSMTSRIEFTLLTDEVMNDARKAPVTTAALPINNGIVTVQVSARALDSTAKNATLVIRVCEKCVYAREPSNFIAPEGDLGSEDRRGLFPTIYLDGFVETITVAVKPKSLYTWNDIGQWFELRGMYRCDNCAAHRDDDQVMRVYLAHP